MEEPFEPDEYEAYAELADTVDLRITAGEQDATWWGFRELIDRAHVDLVQPDVTRCGGITETLRIAELAHVARRRDGPARLEERHHQGRLAALQRGDARRDLAGVLRRRHADRKDADRPAPADRGGRLRRGTDDARPRRRPRRGRAGEPPGAPDSTERDEGARDELTQIAGRPGRPRRRGDARWREQRAAADSGAREPRDRDGRLDVHRRRRPRLHRLPLRLRPAAARPQRPRRRRAVVAAIGADRPDGRRRDAGRDRARGAPRGRACRRSRRSCSPAPAARRPSTRCDSRAPTGRRS